MKAERDFKAHDLMPSGPVNTIDVTAAKLVSKGVAASSLAARKMNAIRENMLLMGSFIGDVSRFAINSVRTDHETRQKRREHLSQYAGLDAPKNLLVMGQFQEASEREHKALADNLVGQLIESSNIGPSTPVTILAIVPGDDFKVSPLVDETMTAMHEAMVENHHLSPSNFAGPGPSGEFLDDATFIVPADEDAISELDRAPQLLDVVLTNIEHYLGEQESVNAAIVLIANTEYGLPPSLGIPEESISEGNSIFSLTDVVDNPEHELLWRQQVAHAT